MKKLEEKNPKMEKWEKNDDQGSGCVSCLNPPPPREGRGYSAKYTPLTKE